MSVANEADAEVEGQIFGTCKRKRSVAPRKEKNGKRCTAWQQSCFAEG